MSGHPLIEGFNIKLKCKKPGHENQPLLFVCNIPNSKEFMFCSNCLITDQLANESKMVHYKTFLETHLSKEFELKEQIAKNKHYIEIFANENNQLEIIKKEEERLHDELFITLLKQTKTLIENTRDKFKFFFKNYYEKIQKAVSNMKTLNNKYILPPLKELLSNVDTNDSNSINSLFELLTKHQINLNTNEPNIEELMKDLPRLSEDKFKKAELDILNFTKDRLKKILEAHVIKI